MRPAEPRRRSTSHESSLHWKSTPISECPGRLPRPRKRSSGAEFGPRMQFIADTGFVAGFWDRNPVIRNWARRIAQQHAGPHLTAEAVLVEASFLVGPQRIARAFVEGDYQV